MLITYLHTHLPDSRSSLRAVTWLYSSCTLNPWHSTWHVIQNCLLNRSVTVIPILWLLLPRNLLRWQIRRHSNVPQSKGAEAAKTF